MFHRLLLAPALALATCTAPLHAHELVRLDVIDRDAAQVLPEYHHRGMDWIGGTPGHRYAVRLTNTTGQRVLVVLSVDGVNAVSGQTAAPSQAGYVLAPWETAEIAGWRKSLDDIAQFVFTDLPDSYAARTGRPDNVGVIGIAVFREKQIAPIDLPPPPVAARSEAGSYSGMTKAAPASADRAMAAEAMPQRIGTGHGQRERAPVGQTSFQRASFSPAQIGQLRYDDVAALAVIGVLPQPYRPLAQTSPKAFPDGFVQDPPRW